MTNVQLCRVYLQLSWLKVTANLAKLLTVFDKVQSEIVNDHLCREPLNSTNLLYSDGE